MTPRRSSASTSGRAVRRRGRPRACSTRLPDLLGEACHAGRPVFAGDRPDAGRADVPRSATATTCSTSPSPTGEAAKTAAVAGRLLGGARATPASPAATRSSPSAAVRPPTWAASSPPPGCAASAWCTCRPPCSAWSTPRSAARPASTPAAGKNLVGCVPRAGRRALRPRPAGHAARARSCVSGLGEVVKCGFIADPEILELVEDDRRRRSTRPPRAARAGRAGGPRQGRRRRRRPHARPVAAAGTRAARCSTTVTPWGTRSSVASDYALRHGEAVAIGMVYVAELARGRRAPRRRGRRPPRRDPGLGRAARPSGTGRPYDDLPAADGAWTRSRAAPSCGSSCSTAWPVRGSWPGRSEEHLRGGVRRDDGRAAR